MQWFVKSFVAVVRERVVVYFMQLIVLWRYVTAPKGASTISIEGSSLGIGK